jgi:glycosyltransferase involved in cell wall biosynthesis
VKIGIDGSLSEKPNRTGMSTYILSILKNIDNLDKKNNYIIFYKNKLPEYLKINDISIPSEVIKKPKILNFTKKNFWNSITLPWNIYKNNIDVFVSPHYTLPYFTPNAKTILILHDISYETNPEWFPKDFVKKIRKRSKDSANKANLIITNSIFSKSEIINNYKIPEKKILVVNPGIFNYLGDTKKKSLWKEISKKYNIKDQYILSVGAMYPRRNIPLLIDVFNNLSNKINYQLLIIGKNQAKNRKNILNLIKKANNKNKFNKIIYIEYVSDIELGYFYSNASLFICLSTNEGFGSFEMHEAMYYGCPVVTSKLSSMPELLSDCGIYVDLNNVDDIQNKIYNVLKNKSQRKKLSIKSKNRIKNFSSENMTKQFISACEKAYEN